MSDSTGRVRTGRRPGGHDTRQDILDAAAVLFSDKGYEGASVRAIASRAGVDPALVRHYFTDKPTLFVEAVTSRTGVVERVLAELRGTEGRRGERLARAYLGVWEDPDARQALTALVASLVTSDAARQILRERLPAAIARGLGLSEEDVTPMGLAGSQLLGVAVARYVVAVPALVVLDLDELVARLGPALDVILAG